MKIGIATDHGGFGLKEELVTKLLDSDHEVIDFGAHKLKRATPGLKEHWIIWAMKSDARPS
jgi:ribose 5-phosphate isomerase RpiB